MFDCDKYADVTLLGGARLEVLQQMDAEFKIGTLLSGYTKHIRALLQDRFTAS